ncbi:hypothetical protein [Scytonema millei]|uniref:hypothetical protein n=1 Tax=Scytonema millei TaxID=1245922 RepID=UPI0014369106
MEFNKQPDPILSDLPPIPPAHWTSTRMSICAWLNEQAPPLAELYEGAVCLIFERPVRGRLRFVSHAVREIRNRLPDYISNEKSGERLNYKDEVDQLLAIWQSSGFSLNEAPSNDGDIPIPLQIFNNIQELLKKHIAVSVNNKEKAIRFFESCISENKPIRNTLLPIVDHWWEVTEWFMENTHDSGKDKLASYEQKLRQQFEVFESFLAAVSQKFYDTVDKLDEILKEANPKQFEQAMALLIHPQHFSYFFNHLQNPKWIKPLKDKGFFQNPPQVIEDASQGTVSFLMWPQSRYLARIAAYQPDAVLEIAQEIETNNPSVYEDFVDAALQMPPEIAVQLVSKVKTWVESSYSLNLLAEKIGAFIVHLAKGGRVKKALDLARTLLFVMPDPDVNNGKADNSIVYRPLPEPRTRLDNWHYQEILKKYIPELVKVAGKDETDVLKMLGFLLFDAIKFSHRDEEIEQLQKNSPIWEDRSLYWRYAIENHPRNRHPYKVKELLVEAVRDAAEQIIKNEPAKMEAIVLTLEQRHWRIFHRIALYLIRKFPNANPDLLIERLVDCKRFIDTSSYEDYEYALLLKEHFAQLPREEQEKIFRWIEVPELDLSWLEEREKKAQWIRYWQRNKLALLKDSLPTQWQQRYDQLINEFGAVELSKIVSGGVGEVKILGIVSPKTDLELESMSIEELVSFLRTWEQNSTDPFEEPSRQGLGSALARLAEKNPQRYAQASAQFQGLHPIYLTNLLRGLRQALNNQSGQQKEVKEFDWASVLCLCSWLAQESEQVQKFQTTDNNSNRDWLEPCRTVADLFEVGLTVDKIGIPYNLREQVWNTLSLLTQHLDPTPEREMGYHGFNNNPSELAINTVRGEALRAVVRYALWIRHHFEQISEGAERLEQGFDNMPEVPLVLDEHLNPDKEPSLAIRTVYGEWLPWLNLLDPHWTIQSIGKIFPQDEIFSDMRRAAWESYITNSNVYDNVFDVLREEYCYRVEQIASALIETPKLTHPDEGLSEHLMTLYWRGKLNLDEPEGLLARFFELASDALRSYALRFVGRSLDNTKDAIDPEILNRLQLLWEKRIDSVRSSADPSSYVSEIATFGWWFSSAKFDDSWAIAQFKQVLELVGKVDPEFLVLKHLAKLADVMPESAVECLKLIIEKDKKGGGIYGWHNDAKTILTTAIKGNNDKARQVAESIIHRLGERGHWEYRDLLSDGK